MPALFIFHNDYIEIVVHAMNRELHRVCSWVFRFLFVFVSLQMVIMIHQRNPLTTSVISTTCPTIHIFCFLYCRCQKKKKLKTLLMLDLHLIMEVLNRFIGKEVARIVLVEGFIESMLVWKEHSQITDRKAIHPLVRGCSSSSRANEKTKKKGKDPYLERDILSLCLSSMFWRIVRSWVV